MKEQNFLKILQERALEQRKIMQAMPFPEFFKTISLWLGVHPWRILIPVALVLSLIFHFSMGRAYDDLILKIFGGFGLIKLY